MKKILPLLFVLCTIMASAQVKITYVNPATDQIKIKNFGASAVNIGMYRLCSLFEYHYGLSDLPILSGDFNLSAGEEVWFTWTASSGFNTSASDLGLYLPAGAFSSASSMVDFMEYGGAGLGRELVADDAGLWTAGTFLTGTGPWYYIGNGSASGIEQWSTSLPVNVTFRVNMSDVTVSPDGVHIAGSFQGWDPATTAMSYDGAGIYTYTTSLIAGNHQYKFVNGNTWPGQETVPSTCGVSDGFGAYNRQVAVSGTSPISISPVCFNACVDCIELPTPVSITFSVDMSDETVAVSGMHIAGSFQSWNPGATAMTDVGDGVYEYTLETFAGTELQYKFINGNDWPMSEVVPSTCGISDGFGAYNRSFTTGAEDAMIDTVCFSSCEACVPVVVEQNMITLRVNMQNQVVSANGVHVAGNFNSWNAGTTELTDADLDGVYEVTFEADEWSNMSFKFINGNTFDDTEVVHAECGLPDGVGGYNRTLETGSVDVSFGPICFGECENCAALPEMVDITFLVNMEDQLVSANGVHLVGNFQEWDPASLEMTDADADGVYEATVSVETGSHVLYRFINGNDWPDSEIVPAGCGEDDGFGAYNRIYDAESADATVGPFCFNACVNCTIIIEPSTTMVTFKVNMQNEIVNINGVHIAGNFQDWNASSFEMMDEDADGIYEYTTEVDSNQGLVFKFINGNDFPMAETVPSECGEGDGFGGFNRLLLVAEEDTTYGPVCFGECSDCETGTGTTVLLAIRVNMSNEPFSEEGVWITGSIGTDFMVNQGDGIYEWIGEFEPGDEISYHFLNGSEDETVPEECGEEMEAGVERTFTVGTENAVWGPVCFGECEDCEIVLPAIVDVTFRVNMQNETVSASGVHVAGNFQGWDPSTSEMTDADADGIYEFTAEIATGYEVLFKFVNGNVWGAGEEVVPESCGQANGLGGFNRVIQVEDEDVVYGPVCFSACEDCLESVPVLITVRVDMTNETVSEDGVFVAGDFNAWDETATQMSEYEPGHYEGVMVVNAGSTTAYKFLNGPIWTAAETVPSECGLNDGAGNINRSYTAGASGATLDLVCFSGCAACSVISTVEISFRVDMSQQVVSADGVFIAGTFNSFSPTATEMEMVSPGIYEAAVEVAENSVTEYKFLNGPDFAFVETVPFSCGVNDGFGGFNRSITVDLTDVDLPEVCFSSCVDCTIGVSEQFVDEFSMYPNPADDGVIINLHGTESQTVMVYDATGKLVLNRKINSGNIFLEVNTWETGIYNVVIPGFASRILVVE